MNHVLMTALDEIHSPVWLKRRRRAKGTLPPAQSFSPHPALKDIPMVIGVAHIAPIVALIAGVLILLVPRLLNLIVAIYLIFVGLVGLGVLSKLGIH
jgi:hypothetical protein